MKPEAQLSLSRRGGVVEQVYDPKRGVMTRIINDLNGWPEDVKRSTVFKLFYFIFQNLGAKAKAKMAGLASSRLDL